MGAPCRSSFRLLDLPAELRNEVYVHTFSTHDHVRHFISPTSANPNAEMPDEDLAPRNNLSLLLTCRKIHAEAALLAFHHTTFLTTERVIETLFHLYHTPIRHDKLSSITSLTISLDPRRKPKENIWVKQARLMRNIAHGIIKCTELITRASLCRLVNLKEVTLLVVDGVVDREDLKGEILFDERCAVCEGWREQFGTECVEGAVQRGEGVEGVELMLRWEMEEKIGNRERGLRICFQFVRRKSEFGLEQR